MSTKKTINFDSINKDIAEGVKTSANEGAVEKVIKKRVEAEVDRRADLLEKALDKYNNAKKEFTKCGPDIISYGVVDSQKEDGSNVPIKNEQYSEKRLKERQNLQKLIADLDIAIMKAFNDGDYSKLLQLAGGGKQNQQQNESAG